MTQSANESEFQVGAYLASWNHSTNYTDNSGNLPTGRIDWDAFTHLFYFALNANSDGALTNIEPIQSMSPARIRNIVSAAHQHDTPILFTVGGWDNYQGFNKAITPSNRSNFISNLINVLHTWGFDGIDLYMDPIKEQDKDNYRDFVEELFSKLEQMGKYQGKKFLLTTATNGHPSLFADIQKCFTQINLMTYNLSSAWDGRVSWHNSAIYSGDYTFPESDKPLPSVNNMVQDFLEAGVPSHKIRIGIDFYGYVWSGGTGTSTGGVTKPVQKWDMAPSVTNNVPFHTIMDSYYKPENYHWDDNLKAAFLSINREGSHNDKFISYDNERTIQAKVNFARKYDLGGVFIWELSGGYRKELPLGQDDLLLQIVKKSAFSYKSSLVEQ